MIMWERTENEAAVVSRRSFAKMAAAAALAVGAGAFSLADGDARGEPDGPGHRRRERLNNRRDRRRNRRDHGPNHR